MLRMLEADLKALGYSPVNPWVVDLPAIFIDGVIFGVGPDLSRKPWSEGNLDAKTLPKERLLYWLDLLTADFRVEPDERRFNRAAPREELEEVYRGLAADLIYRANKATMACCDIMFADLNAYRGDADDGTVMEVIEVVRSGKEVVVLVDENPEPSLNEGVFGRRCRWNVMISGFFKENRRLVRVRHSLDDVLRDLKAWIKNRTG